MLTVVGFADFVGFHPVDVFDGKPQKQKPRLNQVAGQKWDEIDLYKKLLWLFLVLYT